jgi:hypothetical protein
LAAIKFSPTSLGRQDIIEKTTLSPEDVERQVKLLLELNILKRNTRFPEFPMEGWMVFTAQEDHLSIIKILKEHGIEDPRVSETRRLLGDYYPTGMALEGNGIQPTRGGANYTEGLPVIPELEFRPEAIAVMVEFRDSKKPFKPKEFSPQAIEEKKVKWKWFVAQMSAAYHIPEPRVTFGTFSEQSWTKEGSSAKDDNGISSSYNKATNTLFFSGRFSLTTLLHEFGHARGFDERDAIIWSLNFGLRIFPITFNRLLSQAQPGTHMLTRHDETQDRFGGLD